MERIKIRGLVTCSRWIFYLWGAAVAVKGVWDVFRGEPEANLFSPHPWEFVSRAQWLNWSGFEIIYGLACLAAGWLLGRYAARLPEHIERPLPR